MLLGAFIGGWEVVLILAIVLLLFGARKLPELMGGLGESLKEFFNAMDEETLKIRESFARNFPGSDLSSNLKAWIAQGFGAGRAPFAPGTFGSLAALLWLAVLLSTGNFWTYLALVLEGIAFSIWLCDDAEQILGEEDPPSVVLDEIIAIPICFLPWVASEWWRHGALPEVSHFFTGQALWMTLGIVALFRVFDIWKPWPVRQSQRLPGGWGVTADDLLAAIYVALISTPFVLRLP